MWVGQKNRHIQRVQLLDELAAENPKLCNTTDECSDLDHDEAVCLHFLITHMPKRDKRDLNITGKFLVEQTRLALWARNMTSWARNVPW